MRESFVLYTEYVNHIEKLSLEQRGVLFTAILNYESDVDLPVMDEITDMAFSFIKYQLDRDNEKYEKKIEGRRNAGIASGKARSGQNKQTRTKRTNVEFVEQNEQTRTKRTDNVYVYDDDNEDVNDNEDDNNTSDSNESDCQKPQADFRRAIKLWNGLQDLGIKPISRVSQGAKRFDNLRARLRQYGIEEYEKAINRIRSSDFLQGKHNGRPWQITFDWFVLPSNFPKVLDGNYETKTSWSDEVI